MNPISQVATPPSNNVLLTEAYGASVPVESKTQTSQSADKVSLSGQAAKAKPEDASIKQEEVSFSPRAVRAQKIEAMAKDFFADGQFSTADIPKLIQRLHQDGILSDGQLNRLSAAGFEIPQGNQTPESLMQFVDRQKEQLSKTEPDSVLLKVLDDAKHVLEQMDTTDGKETSQLAARVSAQLSVFVNGDVAMSEADKQQWQGLKSTMQLAASMGNSQQSSGQLSSYLALSKRIT